MVIALIDCCEIDMYVRNKLICFVAHCKKNVILTVALMWRV